MTGLVEFLWARLAEDERTAAAASGGPWRAAVDEDGYSICVYGPDRLQDGGREPGSTQRRQVMRPWVVAGPGYEYGGVARMVDGEHIARHDPARVLAEVEARRRIVELHSPVVLHRDGGAGYYDTVTVCRSCGGTDAHFADGTPAPGCPALHPCPTLRLYALPDADHPDYREEWRPVNDPPASPGW